MAEASARPDNEGVSSFAAKEEQVKLRHSSRQERRYDERVIRMLDRYVRTQRGTAPIVMQTQALRKRLHAA
jgi:hypothetical protein